MKASLKPLLLAALLAGAALPALAEPGAGPSAAPSAVKADGQRQDRWQQRMARHAAELKAELKLSAEQEAAWASYLAALKPPADGAPPQRIDFSKLSTPERLDRMRELRQQRDAAFERHEAATRGFYAALNAEQRKIFDERTARLQRRGGHHRHHG